MQTAGKAKKPVLPKLSSGVSWNDAKPLATIEDKELRKKLRNRQSALAARERKKAHMLHLEKRVKELQLENDMLKRENLVLKRSNGHLRISDCCRDEHGSDRCTPSDCSKLLHKSGSVVGEIQTYPPTMNPNQDVPQRHSIRKSEDLSLAYPPQPVAGIVRKHSAHQLPMKRDSKAEDFPDQCNKKPLEKRRKSCPSYANLCMSKEFQWPTASDMTSAQTSPLSAMSLLPSRKQSSHHSSLIPPSYQEFHGNNKQAQTAIWSAPVMDDVFDSDGVSANGATMIPKESQHPRDFNFSSNSKWQNADSVGYAYHPLCANDALKGYCHEGAGYGYASVTTNLAATNGYLNTAAYQLPNAEFTNSDRPETSTSSVTDEVFACDDSYSYKESTNPSSSFEFRKNSDIPYKWPNAENVAFNSHSSLLSNSAPNACRQQEAAGYDAVATNMNVANGYHNDSVFQYQQSHLEFLNDRPTATPISPTWIAREKCGYDRKI